MAKRPFKNYPGLIFSEPAVLAECQGVPVHTYGYTHVYGASPDLTGPLPLQVGNAQPVTKLPLKKSNEIHSNRLGGTAPRMPRTIANDYLPLEPIHLIDGNPETCWSSKTQTLPDSEPAWIRIDLAREQVLHRLVLRKRLPGAPRNQPGSMPLDQGAVEVGMAVPQRLCIRFSRDGRIWQTVFDGPSGDTPERHEFACDFPPAMAKQVWIVGHNLPRIENWLYSFSIAGVELFDGQGENVALVSRGAGVNVSSTQHSMGQTRDEHRWLWPLHADLGLKWVRIGYHDDPVNWHWVEKEKGKMAVDPEADAAIDFLVENGIDVVLALGFGNRHYTQEDPARKLPQLWEWYYENPLPPVTPEALKAWGRYVRFMCRHYRGRIRYFEVWNEWNVFCYWGAPINVEHYLAVARVAIPIIRQECPEAKVMFGSVAGFCHELSLKSPEEITKWEQEMPMLQAIKALAREVDVIGWHPFYQADPASTRWRMYAADVRRFQEWCRQQGFHGEYMVTEWSIGANYPPPAPPNWWGDYACSEMVKAKLVAQLSVLHTALGVGSFFCETFSNYYPLDLTLLRRNFAADPISPQQPQAAYYVMRNLATALDSLQPAEFAIQLAGATDGVQAFAMARDGERVVALWRSGQPADLDPGISCDVTVAGRYRKATGYDPLNGTLQELQVEAAGDQTKLSGILVRDYPLLLRFE